MTRIDLLWTILRLVPFGRWEAKTRAPVLWNGERKTRASFASLEIKYFILSFNLIFYRKFNK